jgi:hypothetical protein
MPINYLHLQPQIKEYSRQASVNNKEHAGKIERALDLLHRFAQEIDSGLHRDLSVLESADAKNRCARPDKESIANSFPANTTGAYNLLASDGSQISSSHHDALPISLINTSTIFLQPGSNAAPLVDTQTEFIRKPDSTIQMDIIPEDLINTMRDVKELQVLANCSMESDLPLVALSDGPLELFLEPRSDKQHKELFDQYLESLHSIHRNGKIMGGYTDKPRARLVLRMLELIYSPGLPLTPDGITDADIFTMILPPGHRSAIFQINSPSSNNYIGPLALRFFYLNVGREEKPWIVRIETTASTSEKPAKVQMLHKALLDQCDLMGGKPYPYILHRAHEEAVVRFDEKEAISAMLSYTLRSSGVEFSSQSNKSSAKDLKKRKRMK